MSEITKLTAKVKNAEKYKSPELKITFKEAQGLVTEIESLQEEIKLLKDKPVVKEVKQEPKSVTLDGGNFNSH